jgi:hypothetical protein
MVDSTSEQVVVVEAAVGTSKATGRPYGIVKVRPIRDKEAISHPVDYRCDPPELAKQVGGGDVVVLKLRTELSVFGQTARTDTGCVGISKAAA